MLKNNKKIIGLWIRIQKQMKFLIFSFRKHFMFRKCNSEDNIRENTIHALQSKMYDLVLALRKIESNHNEPISSQIAFDALCAHHFGGNTKGVRRLSEEEARARGLI